mgnify:CR=1 FL=1
MLGGHERTIEGVIVEDPARSRFYEPFTRPRPASISEADWTAMQARARTIMTCSECPGRSMSSFSST